VAARAGANLELLGEPLCAAVAAAAVAAAAVATAPPPPPRPMPPRPDTTPTKHGSPARDATPKSTRIQLVQVDLGQAYGQAYKDRAGLTHGKSMTNKAIPQSLNYRTV
jgi:hypothetical protein